MSGFIFVLFLTLISCIFCNIEAPTFTVPTRKTSSLVYYVRNEGFASAVSGYTPLLEGTILASHIPDVKQTLNTSTGKIEIAITNIAITSFSLGDISVETNPSNYSLRGVIRDCFFELKFDYSYKQLSFPYRSESGYGTVSTMDLSINSELSGKRVEETGALALTMEEFSFDIGDLKIELEGGALADLVKSLENMFSDLINDVISSAITSFFIDFITPALDKFASETLAICKEDISCIDLRLGDDLDFESEGLRGYFGGTFYYMGHQDIYEEPKFGNIPATVSSSMLQIQFGNPTFQTLFNVIYQGGYLSLSNEPLGPETPMTISYNDIVSYYPEWAKSYPSGTNGSLSITGLDAPDSEIMYNGLRIIFNLNVELTPIGQDDVTNISSNIELTTIGDFYWRNYHGNNTDTIVDQPEIMTVELSYVSLDVANSDSVNEDWMEMIMNNYYIPQINGVLNKLYITIFQALGLTYYSPKVSYNGDYVMVSADLQILLNF